MASLLVLTLPIQRLIPSINSILTAALARTSRRLYVHLDVDTAQRKPSLQSLSSHSKLISHIYSQSSLLSPHIDIRVLLCGFKCLSEIPTRTNSPIGQVLIDTFQNDEHKSKVLVEKYKSFCFNSSVIHLLEYNDTTSSDDAQADIDLPIYESVVVGGTFDRIHCGHKIFLTEGILRCTRKFTIGIANGPLLRRKVLKELILPCDQRISELRNFLTDVDNSLEYYIVPITEPLGPTSSDHDMNMIVVSEETKKGGELVNKHRKDEHLPVLDVHCIKLIEDNRRQSMEEEEKFSSSSQRMRLLGTKLRKSNKPHASPYVIGLSGGSASGKTNICQKLLSLGAGVVNCDKLGHEAYKKGTDCYNDLVKTFGVTILDGDGNIDRKQLGMIAFGNPDNLKALNSIVWPQIARLTGEQITRSSEEGCQVVILDAAVLIEAGWDALCNEVWVTIVDREEAIQRIVERDGKTPEEAIKRIDSQMSNEDRVARANVVFCSKWAKGYTEHQVETAWSDLVHEGIVTQVGRSSSSL